MINNVDVRPGHSQAYLPYISRTLNTETYLVQAGNENHVKAFAFFAVRSASKHLPASQNSHRLGREASQDLMEEER